MQPRLAIWCGRRRLLRWARSLSVILVLCSGIPTAATASTTMSGMQAERVVYRWSFQKQSGRASGNLGAWNHRRNVLTYDGAGNTVALSPYNVHSMTNFAVQARIRTPGPGGPLATLAGFGLVVRKTPTDPHTSIEGGSFFSSNPEDNNPEIYWNGATVGGEAFQPGTRWHLYRLEIRGHQYTLRIDGKIMVQYDIEDYPNPVQAGVFSTYYRVEVRDFVVIALDPSTLQSAAFPPVRQYDLTLSDMPTTGFFEPIVQHYYPNTETARERNVTLASIDASGRISGYGIDFYVADRRIADVYGGVTAFRDAASAQADIATRLHVFAQQYATFRHFQELPAGLVGENSGGLSFEYDVDNESFTTAVLYFARARYTGLIRLTVATTGMTSEDLQAQLVEFGKIIDERIQRAGV